MRNKLLQETALLSQEQGIPTDQVSIGGLTNGLSGLVKRSVDHPGLTQNAAVRER